MPKDYQERELLDRAALSLRELGRSAASADPSTALKLQLGSSAMDGRWTELENLSRAAWEGPRVGDMPPAPPTFRARVGALLVSIIRRALFWYSDQIQSFHRLVSAAAREQLSALHHLTEAQQRLDAAIEASRDELRRTDSAIEASRDELRRTAAEAESRAAEHLRAEFDQDIQALRAEIRERATEEQKQAEERQKGIEARKEVEAELHDLGRLLHEYHVHSVQQSARISSLLRELRSRRPPAGEFVATTSEAEIDDHILQHATAFRGELAEIRDRLRVYLPYARKSFEAAGGAPILDLGCGRGEWLDLMREEQLPASGVDASASMVEQCRARGLEAAQADILAHLRTLPDESCSLITAYHVVEHLPLNGLLELLDHSVRILKPGGMIILETPNPRNIFVGASNFHLDPTHVRPLPAELLSFLAESRGFCDIETVLLHPYPESYRLDESGCPAANFINQHFLGPQDYSVIGKRV